MWLVVAVVVIVAGLAACGASDSPAGDGRPPGATPTTSGADQVPSGSTTARAAPATTGAPATTEPTVAGAEPDALLFDRFTPEGHKNTYIAASDGSDARPIVADPPVADSNVQHADWSPDGRWIAFEVLETTGETPAASVWIVAAAGGPAQRVAACDVLPCIQYAYPDWSPDGTQLALLRFGLYADQSCCSSELVVLDVRLDGDTWSTGDSKVLASFTAADAIDSWDSFLLPAWSPDGRRLIYNVEQYGFDDPYPFLGTRVAVVSASGGDSRFLTDRELQIGDAEWHPCADLLAVSSYPLVSFQSSTEPGNIYLLDPGSRALTQLTDTSVDGSMRFGTPAWSTDGSMLAVTIARASDGMHLNGVNLALVDPASGAVTELGVSGAGPKFRPVPGTACAGPP